MNSPMPYRSLSLFVWGIILLTGASEIRAAEPGTLVVAFSRRLLSDVHENDALAAAQVWIDKLAEELGQDVITDSQTYLVSGADELNRLSEQIEVDVAILHPVEFVLKRNRIGLEPVFTATRDGEVAYGLSLLVRADSGLQSLEDLRGKTLVGESSTVGILPDLWISSLLDKRDLPEASVFFGERKRFARVTQAALAVFFGQADACTVKLDSYKTLVEMNPQVGASLVSIEHSMDFCRTVICVREPLAKSSILVRDAMMALHDTTRGRQLLTMFNVDKLVPFKEQYLDGVRYLLQSVDASALVRTIKLEGNGP